MAGTTKSSPNLADALNEEWDTVQTGLGTAFDPETQGPLVGSYLGAVTKDINGRAQVCHQFAPASDPELILFVWGGYELDEAMSTIKQGTKCRISFVGRSQFSKDGQARQIKHYKVQTAKS